MVIAAGEGAVVLARAQRSTVPFDAVAGYLLAQVVRDAPAAPAGSRPSPASGWSAGPAR